MPLTTVSTVSAAQSGVPGPAGARVAGGPGCYRSGLSHFLERTSLMKEYKLW